MGTKRVDFYEVREAEQAVSCHILDNIRKDQSVAYFLETSINIAGLAASMPH